MSAPVQTGAAVKAALQQAEAFIAEELKVRQRSYKPASREEYVENIKPAEDALLAVRDALRELR